MTNKTSVAHRLKTANLLIKKLTAWVFASLLMISIVPIGHAETEQDAAEPEVIIKQDGDKRISEYYVHGRLVEIKVEPKNAPTYYLIPSNSGDFERSDESRLLLPTWKILEW